MRKILAALTGAGLVLALTSCGSEEIPADSVYANQGVTVGISMPNKTSTRWIADGKAMADQFSAMGYKVNLKYAEDDAKKQSQQLQGMLDEGDKLLVIAAFDGSSLNDVLAKAHTQKVPVIAYDRLLTGTKNVDYQATFDNQRVGVLQAQLLVDRLGLDGKGNQDDPPTVELFAGAATDANAKSFYDGSMTVLRPYLNDGKIVVRSGETRFKPITTERYDPGIAGARMTKILKADYQDENVDAVLSPYDGMSIGIIKALKADGYGKGSKPLPIISGQDAELPSVKSIIDNEQTQTIFKDTRELAKVAVQQGNALLTKSDPMVNDTASFDNGEKIVPTYLLYPVAVDRDNYKTLLVDSGYIKASDLL